MIINFGRAFQIDRTTTEQKVDKRDQKSTDMWEEKDYKLLKKVKKSIVGNKNTPHFGALGNYFSFGMNRLYRINEKSLLLVFTEIKKGKTKNTTKI